MSDLIIKENNREVDQQLITQTLGYEGVSHVYKAIPTQDIITEIGSYIGSEPKIVGFNKSNTRKADKQHFTKHAVMLELPNAEMLDGTSMRLTIFNSNDRSSALKIYYSAHRMICSNGLVWGEGSGIPEPVSLRHTKNQEWQHSIKSLMDQYEETQRNTQDMINRMMSRYVSYGDIGRFTERVTEELLNPDITGSVLDPVDLNKAHRKEDVGKDLWRTFNRIQSNLMNGGIDRVIDKQDDDGKLFTTISKTHIITDSKKQIDFNRKLHTMAMEML